MGRVIGEFDVVKCMEAYGVGPRAQAPVRSAYVTHVWRTLSCS